MSTRIITSPDLAGTGAGSPRSRLQRPIDLEIDGIDGIDGQESPDSGTGGGGAGGQYNQIRPTSSFSFSLPPLISNARRTDRLSPTTTTTQQPRPSHSPPPPPPPLPFSGIQTPPRRRATNLSSANVELPPINIRENEQSGQYSRSRDLDNLLFSANFEDPYLSEFVDGDFSSPSTYPSFTNADSQPSQAFAQGVSQTSALQASVSAPHRAVANSATAAPRDPSVAHHCISNFLGPERSTTQLSSSTNAAGESQSTLPIFDSFDENEILLDSPASSFSDAMPPALRRTTAAAHRAGSTHASKRRRTSTATVNGNTVATRPSSRQKKSSAPNKEMDVEELFGSSPPPRAFVDLEANQDYETVDLTETNEIPEDVKKPEKDERIKLAAFHNTLWSSLLCFMFAPVP
ncbi:e3 ubiquitin- ligase complex slx8-rfp subunit slx8 [Fusarium longipes]|uniref:E3 ubiquitin-ligase complex slx8-rfp subunit slx8 n=1 Tax=Fusarium longipes TaxID=694270 RepID=A0A395SGH0_9HYPO|nr:e3 ubiquitin- ligase complex slx8-rfp subunit slx8 [Fusarium longipes]